MQMDTGKITTVQLMFSMACYIQASSLLTSFFVAITKQDSWIVVLIGMALCLPFLWIYIWLMDSFPDKNLLHINDLVFGPVAGKIVSILYIWFFITLASLNLRDLGDFVEKTIMQKTPGIVILVVFMLVCAWAVRYGVAVVTRYSTFFCVVALAVLATTALFTSNLVDLNNFLPMFDLPVMSYIQGTHIIMTIPFGEVIVFLMITPNIKRSSPSIWKYFLGGFAIGGVTLLVVVLRDTAVLGNTLSLFALPPFETLRMVSLTHALSRMEILFAIALTLLLFAKVTFLYYVTALALAQLLKLDTFKPIVLTIGGLITTYALILYTSTVQHAASASEVTPILWLPFEFILPLSTLLIAKARKLSQKERVG